MQLTRRFAAELVAQGLESWTFLDFRGCTPEFTSPFGDVFFSGRGGIWFLDTLEGTFERVWSTQAELAQALGDQAGQDRYLMAGLAIAVDAAGLVAEGTDVYDFVVPPVLGGPFTVDNIELRELSLKLDIAGQIHAGVRGMAPGTPITGVTIASERT